MLRQSIDKNENDSIDFVRAFSLLAQTHLYCCMDITFFFYFLVARCWKVIKELNRNTYTGNKVEYERMYHITWGMTFFSLVLKIHTICYIEDEGIVATAVFCFGGACDPFSDVVACNMNIVLQEQVEVFLIRKKKGGWSEIKLKRIGKRSNVIYDGPNGRKNYCTTSATITLIIHFLQAMVFYFRRNVLPKNVEIVKKSSQEAHQWHGTGGKKE